MLHPNVIDGARPAAVAQHVAANVRIPPRPKTFTYETNINQARLNGFLVGFARETEDQGGRDYIFVGKVTRIDLTTSTLQFKTLRSTKDPWTSSCVDSPWHPVKVGKRTDECSFANVIKYFNKLNSKNSFPKAVKDIINKHKIKWSAPDDNDDDPEDTDPEFEETFNR